MKKIKIKLVKSLIGRKPCHIGTAKSLGLKNINDEMVHNATADILGKTKQLSYLLEVEEV